MPFPTCIIESLERRRLLSGVTFPAGLYGVVDVSDFGAIPNDGIDDTNAINAAFAAIGANSRRTLYFPDGVYDISGQLLPETGNFINVKRTSLQGQSEDGTILRLAAGTFTDAADTTPVIDYRQNNNVAQAFHNHIADVTLEVMPDNAGAVGIAFNSNNSGSIRRVTITEVRVPGDADGNGTVDLADFGILRANFGTSDAAVTQGDFNGDGSVDLADFGILRANFGATETIAAPVGLDLFVAENGPLFIQDVTVNGFDVGVRTVDHINSQTFEHLALHHQREAGFVNGANGGGRQAVAIRGLTSTNDVTVFDARREDPDPSTLIVEADVRSPGGTTEPAINTGGSSFVRDVTASGFGSSVEQKWDAKLQSLGDDVVAEASSWGSNQSDGFATLFDTTETSLDLEIRDTPRVDGGDPTSEWIVLTNGPGDDTAAIQAAIDTPGIKTVVLDGPSGFDIDGTLILRGDVERLVAFGGTVSGDGTIRLDDGAASTVRIDRLYGNFNNSVAIEHNATRTLVVSDSGVRSYTNTAAGTGDVFLEDVIVRQVDMANQNGWFKQINMEPPGDTLGTGAYFTNDGGTASILGLKTEYRGSASFTFIHTLGGGSTELLGGVLHLNAGTWAADEPAFRVTDANFGLAAVKRYDPGVNNSPTILVTETQNGETRQYTGGKQSYFIARSADPAASSLAPTSGLDARVASVFSTQAIDDERSVFVR
ncbi:MAG: glycosyl hydrolase family 28-related protein [Planctomycetota bacterium]